MMLNIARFIIASPKWNDTNIRVLFVNNNNVDVSIIEAKISKLVEDLRVNVDIKIINNAVEQKTFYSIIEEESKTTDLTIIGIPDYNIEKQAEFVLTLFTLLSLIASTKNNPEFKTLALPGQGSFHKRNSYPALLLD